MAYKDILVHLDSDKAAGARLDVACALAIAHNAHLTAIHVVAPPYVPVDIGAALPAQLVQLQEENARERAAQAERMAQAAETRNGFPIEWRAPRGDVQRTLLTHSHYADLIVVGQGGDDMRALGESELAETLVIGSSRPVLIVPRYGRFDSVGQRVLVAWNGTREASRALHDSLPILVDAAAVTVLQINPAPGEAPRIPGADIGAHLARHGVRANSAIQREDASVFGAQQRGIAATTSLMASSVGRSVVVVRSTYSSAPRSSRRRTAS